MKERSAHYCSYVVLFPLSHTSGTLDLNLSAMPEPASSASSCSLDMLPEEAGEGEKQREVKLVDLFKKKRMKGWWPVYSQEEGTRELAVSGEGKNGAHSETARGGLWGHVLYLCLWLVPMQNPVYLKTVLDL